MEQQYVAHINEMTGAVQTVEQHCEAVARLCSASVIPEWRDFAYGVGLAHDIGKYQESFARRIAGENIRVEHSTCGALAVREKYSLPQYPNPMSLMMEYCIAGHHSGIPDGGFPNDTSDQSTLCGRMKRNFEDYSKYREELTFPEIDGGAWAEILVQDCNQNSDILIDKFAFLTRYMFSCLVDADSKDTADFCRIDQPERQLRADFSACLEKVNEQMAAFQFTTPLQEARAVLQTQAFENAKQDAEIYLLSMPTGSGKTLTSVKIALEKAIANGRKRIIYVIPYNSIIDQTADVFGRLFVDDLEILRHQSTFSYEDEEDINEDYREAAKCAAENWDAPFIITTAVQFFETLYANKRSKLRKLHNMADSVLIFDEAHLMPEDYLQPCLQGIVYLTRYLHSEALFLTATMPDYMELIKEYVFPGSKVQDLISDTSSFSVFQKCRYQCVGEQRSEEILMQCQESPSSLIIVNRRATARELFQACTGEKFHLSTYMTAYDRKRILQQIRTELLQLEMDYPNLIDVPEERRITMISTSLIEAGVDLDVYTVFRELAGLDHILQAGGRCNREGKRESGDVYVFEWEEDVRRPALDVKANLTKGLIKKYEDISDAACIAEYYRRLFFMNQEEIEQHTMHNQCSDISSIPFQSYAKSFELIDSKTVSLVVPRDAKSESLRNQLQYTQQVNVRELQNYTVTLYQWELDDLMRQHVVDDFGTGIYCLTNLDYYNEQIGILFEAKDYFL